MKHSLWIFIHITELLSWKQDSVSIWQAVLVTEPGFGPVFFFHPACLDFEHSDLFHTPSLIQDLLKENQACWSVFSKFTSASGNHHQLSTFGRYAEDSHNQQFVLCHCNFLEVISIHYHSRYVVCHILSGQHQVSYLFPSLNHKSLYFNLYSILNFYFQLLQVLPGKFN